MSPLAGVPILFLSFPGVLPLNGAPPPGYCMPPRMRGALEFASLTLGDICPTTSNFSTEMLTKSLQKTSNKTRE